MSQVRQEKQASEATPVDDVRRVRERLSREAGGDVKLLADRVQAIANQLRDELGLKPFKP